MNREKIKIANKIGINPKEIIFDLKSKSLYTTIDGKRVGCYYDEQLQTIVMYGDLQIAQYFIKGLIKLLDGLK